MRAEKKEAVFVKDKGSAIIHGDIEGSFTFTYNTVLISYGSTYHVVHVGIQSIRLRRY